MLADEARKQRPSFLLAGFSTRATLVRGRSRASQRPLRTSTDARHQSGCQKRLYGVHRTVLTRRFTARRPTQHGPHRLHNAIHDRRLRVEINPGPCAGPSPHPTGNSSRSPLDSRKRSDASTDACYRGDRPSSGRASPADAQASLLTAGSRRRRWPPMPEARRSLVGLTCHASARGRAERRRQIELIPTRRSRPRAIRNRAVSTLHVIKGWAPRRRAGSSSTTPFTAAVTHGPRRTRAARGARHALLRRPRRRDDSLAAVCGGGWAC